MKAGTFLALMILLFSSGNLFSEIYGFKINYIKGLNGVELSDRFGTTSFAEEHLINYKDCLNYLGISEGEVISVEDTQTYLSDTYDTYNYLDTLTDTSDDTSIDTSASRGDDDGLIRKIEISWVINDSSLTDYQKWNYSIKIGNCSESANVDDEETDSCKYLVTKTELKPFVENKFEVPITEFLGTSCPKGTTGEIKIYFYIQSDLDLTQKTSQVVKFEYDYEAPKPVTNVTIEEGENNLTVSFDDEDNNEEVTYKVYYATRPFGEEDLESDDVHSKDGITAKIYQITDVQIGQKYYVGVVSVDRFDNESSLSDIVTGTPIKVNDGFEYYKELGGREDGGFCFIATAAYGSYLDPTVKFLRQFRDKFLFKTPEGSLFVYTYYKFSPPIAATIKNSPVLKGITRVLLFPLVAFAYASLHGWILLLLLFAILSGFALFNRSTKRGKV